MHVLFVGSPVSASRRAVRAQSIRNLGFAGLVACALLGAPPSSAGGPDVAPLTLSAALVLAEERSRALVAQDHVAAAARDRAVSAGRLPDPVLRLSLDNVPVDGPMRYSLSDDFMTMRSVGITQTLTGADKRAARSARFEREADAAVGERLRALSALRQATARAWFDHRFARERLDLLQRQRDEAGLQVEAAEAAYRGKRGSQADVFLARSARGRVEDAIVAARAGLDAATHRLERWVGADAVRAGAAAYDLGRTRLEPRALEVAALPEVAAMAAREDVARAEADVALQERSADWSVSLMYSQRGAAFADMVSVGVSVPLQWDRRNRQDRELSARLAEAEQWRAEREELERETLARLRADLAVWRGNLQRLADYDRSLIPLADERIQAALSAYRGGKAPLAAVLDARAAALDTRLERLRIEAETARAWVALEYLLPEAPGAGPQTSRVELLEVAR